MSTTTTTTEPGAPTKRRIKKRTGTTRERTGCVTCRRRKKKCDGGYPVCNHCRRLNFECVREEPRPAAATNKAVADAADGGATSSVGETTMLATSSATVLPVPSSTWIAPILSLDPVASWPGTAGSGTPATSRRFLMRYYLQTLSTLLTTTLENNCFASVFLPMATESPMLLNAIIAHSSSHLALRDSSYEILALQSRCDALSSLSSSLSSQNRDSELDLSCCLILCSMESILGDTSKWYNHLLGASQIITASSTSASTGQLSAEDLQNSFNSFEGQWLKRNFAFHDVLHSVTMDTRPLISGYYWQSDTEDADPYFGLGSKIIHLISEISVLNADMAESATLSATQSTPPTAIFMDEEIEEEEEAIQTYEIHDVQPILPWVDYQEHNVSRSDFSSRAYRLESQLSEWKCSETQDIHLMAMAEAYRSAALIHLYRVIRRHLPDMAPTLDRKIAGPVQAIIENAEKMPLRCLPETTILFPLFMAGGETDDENQVRAIRQRLLDIVQYRHFRNVDVALAVLDELWRLRAGGTPGTGQKRVDWLDVLSRRQWRLALT
ncbi:uncharacterized protein K452DRAFT_288281 [Aplosporella prunicola CBS 121167]|uniref:Zn(2)-C6 fungal-type domain-containing protein n=1 Tax=Aplosporella prunicola CBS 121167 TaxID=1176127 RepID=A0A6A6BC91_9PEZI|nr:uncharacterized protein K452DRAFT_288281 [Aplosporella prunicola CBS 121167]KAF2140875.1 hypothetical protein K452DRAFT_288281 [Aplosporella prunicola CBS 121167]